MDDLQDLIDQWDNSTLAARAYPETFIAGFLKAARQVADGKRQWFCDAVKDLWDDPGCDAIHPELEHDKCGWVLVLMEDADA